MGRRPGRPCPRQRDRRLLGRGDGPLLAAGALPHAASPAVRLRAGPRPRRRASPSCPTTTAFPRRSPPSGSPRRRAARWSWASTRRPRPSAGTDRGTSAAGAGSRSGAAAVANASEQAKPSGSEPTYRALTSGEAGDNEGRPDCVLYLCSSRSSSSLRDRAPPPARPRPPGRGLAVSQGRSLRSSTSTRLRPPGSSARHSAPGHRPRPDAGQERAQPPLARRQAGRPQPARAVPRSRLQGSGRRTPA